MSLQNLVIVTGTSGSGKGTALKAFEDLGFFCIDNLPLLLIPKFVDAFHVSGGEVENAALVIDIRAGEGLRELERILVAFKDYGFRLFVLYLEAREEVLIRRFSETRRPHPLSAEKSLREAIRTERKRLAKVREMADVVMDTSEYSIHQVKALVTERFRTHPHAALLKVNLLSFGYKHGIPLESDLLFDVRFLPNPYFVPGLRSLPGKDRKVARYLRSFAETRSLVHRLCELIKYLVPFYIREGKSYLTVGIGCTGGRHRSVFIAEELDRVLGLKKTQILVRHRDLNR